MKLYSGIVLSLLMLSCAQVETVQLDFRLADSASIGSSQLVLNVSGSSLQLSSQGRASLDVFAGDTIQVQLQPADSSLYCISSPQNFVAEQPTEIIIHCFNQASTSLLDLLDDDSESETSDCLERLQDPQFQPNLNANSFCGLVYWLTEQAESGQEQYEAEQEQDHVDEVMTEIVAQLSATYDYDFDTFIPVVQGPQLLWVYLTMRHMIHDSSDIWDLLDWLIPLFEILFGIGVLVGLAILLAHFLEGLTLTNILDWLWDSMRELIPDNEFIEDPQLEYANCLLMANGGIGIEDNGPSGSISQDALEEILRQFDSESLPIMAMLEALQLISNLTVDGIVDWVLHNEEIMSQVPEIADAIDSSRGDSTSDSYIACGFVGYDAKMQVYSEKLQPLQKPWRHRLQVDTESPLSVPLPIRPVRRMQLDINLSNGDHNIVFTNNKGYWFLDVDAGVSVQRIFIEAEIESNSDLAELSCPQGKWSTEGYILPNTMTPYSETVRTEINFEDPYSIILFDENSLYYNFEPIKTSQYSPLLHVLDALIEGWDFICQYVPNWRLPPLDVRISKEDRYFAAYNPSGKVMEVSIKASVIASAVLHELGHYIESSVYGRLDRLPARFLSEDEDPDYHREGDILNPILAWSEGFANFIPACGFYDRI